MDPYIGIDISKDTFDVHVLSTSQDRRFDYNDQGMEDCANWLLAEKAHLIVMENTGGYEKALASFLMTRGIVVAVVNPRRIRDFARAKGQLAKTDKLDAKIIAQYASLFEPPPQKDVDELSLKIRDLIARRDQLVHMRTQEKNRKDHYKDKVISKSISNIIEAIDNEIEKVDKLVSDHIDNSPTLKEKKKLYKTVPGVGDVTAALLVSELPELGTLDRRKIAALTGLAPINRDSGKMRGRSTTGGGRKGVRRAIYMPILSSIQYNPVLRSYYQRLIKNGKAPKVAIVACMRKFLSILNAMAAHNEPWSPNFA